MNKIAYLSVVIFLLIYEVKGQSNLVLTNGARMVVSPASYVLNISDLTIQSAATLTNNGTVSMKGDFTNNGSAAVGSGLIAFNGTTTQNIGGATSTSFNQLTVNNIVQLAASASVNSTLNFQSGKLNLGTGNLTIGSGGTITGYNGSRYINASESGKLIQNVGASDKVFPVGNALSYVPITLNNAGTADNYGVRVFDDVLNNGTSGGTIASINDVVDMTWVVDEATAGGSNLTATCQWNAANEGASFDRSHSGIGVYTSGAWNPQNEGAASGSNPYSRTRTGITTPGPLAVGDVNSPMAILVGLTVNLKEYFEGSFTGSEMTTLLNSGGLLPLSQPYNTAPWNYTGTESVASIPNANVTEWVVVELRDAPSAAQATIATRIARQAAFVLKNGQIVGMDGASPLQFNVSVTNQLFAIVWFRNHLAVMSANALINQGGTYAYDFTTGAGQVYGGANAHKMISSGIWGMISGDGDANGTVNSNDESVVWTLNAGNKGYYAGDYNLNGQVQNQDKNDMLVPNMGKQSAVP